MLIIGSTAIKHHFKDFPREPNDLDLIVRSKKGFVKKDKVEFLLNPILMDYKDGQTPISPYLSPNELLTLKMSHICYDINWDKHMFDIQFLLSKGAEKIESLYQNLVNYWKEYHPLNKRSDLTLEKEAFFDNNVNNNSEYEHDFIHTLINPTPMYTRVLMEGKSVELDENKFKALTHDEKLLFVKEEVFVMAWERFKRTKYSHAYALMLKKFIREHIPMFALDFAVYNYKELIKLPINYIKIINDGLQQDKRVLS